MFRLPRSLPSWSRASASAAPEADEPEFDALIDIDLAYGASPLAVRRAIGALPGARWISVERHPVPDGLAIRLFPPGSSTAQHWPALRTRVEGAVAALRAESTAVPAFFPDAPRPAATGFAEAMSPSQFDALQQLADLAASRASPPPAGPDGAAMVSRLLGFVLPTDPGPAAAAALRRFGSYAAVLSAPEAELRQVPGLGTHGIAAIRLVHEAAVRLARAEVAALPVLDDPRRLTAYLSAALGRERVEQFRILFLDGRGMLKADEVQARGTVNHTPVYPREVVRRALQLGAASIVLVHNHPSGDPEPSREDIEMTRQVRQAARVMQLDVRDHVIIGNGRILSFREAGLL